MKNTEVKPFNGTPAAWATAFKVMLKNGTTMEELNQTNHLALEHKVITLDHFTAAAEVLKNEILKR